jgi:hypothetical protein
MAKYYNLLQLNYKILINSAYGYLGSKFSRFYDLDNAQAVTMCGRTLIVRTGNTVEDFFATKFVDSEWGKSLNAATNFSKCLIAQDTDSCYVSSNGFIKSVGIYDKSDDEIIDFLNKNYEENVQKTIDESNDILVKSIWNCNTNKIYFKRESICKRAVFIQKKRYALWILNDEGNVPVNKMKVTGIEIVRSSSPTFARKNLKSIVFDILRVANRAHTVSQIKEAREEFFKAALDDITFPITCGKLDKYEAKYEEDGEEFKGTPGHVKGAMIHNRVLQDRPHLLKKYDLFYQSDKGKKVFLKTDGKWIHDAMCYKKWITELNIDHMIDKGLMFEKAMISPMERFFKVLDWPLPRFDHHSFNEVFKKK